MISTLMDRMLDHRLLAVAVAVVLLLGGLYAFQHLSIETIPIHPPHHAAHSLGAASAV